MRIRVGCDKCEYIRKCMHKYVSLCVHACVCNISTGYDRARAAVTHTHTHTHTHKHNTYTNTNTYTCT